MILQEFKARLKSLLLWIVATVAMMAWGMVEYASMAPALSMNVFMEKLPKVMMAMYGMYGVDLNSLRGYFGVMIFFVSIILAVHGAFLGSSLIYNEFKDRTAEFLFSRPSSRIRILLRKFIAGLLMVVIFQSVMAIVDAVIFYELEGEGLLLPSTFALLVSHFFFYCLGFGLAALLPPKRGQRISLIVIVLGYLAVVFSQLLDREGIKNMTPIGLFGNKFLEKELSEFYFPAAVFLGGALLLMFLGLKRFEQRDLEI